MPTTLAVTKKVISKAIVLGQRDNLKETTLQRSGTIGDSWRCDQPTGSLLYTCQIKLVRLRPNASRSGVHLIPLAMGDEINGKLTIGTTIMAQL